MKRILLLCILLCSGSLFLQAQVTTVRGTVTDSLSGETLPGVSVTLLNGLGGTSTDDSGNFELDIPGPDAVLVFSFLGYQSQQVRRGGGSALQVRLVTAAAVHGEVEVVGYGGQETVSVTWAIAA